MRRIRHVEGNKTYLSIQECAEAIDGDAHSIMRVAQGKRASYRGDHFEYVGAGRRVLNAETEEIYDSAQDAIAAIGGDKSTLYKVFKGQRFSHRNTVLRYID